MSAKKRSRDANAEPEIIDLSPEDVIVESHPSASQDETSQQTSYEPVQDTSTPEDSDANESSKPAQGDDRTWERTPPPVPEKKRLSILLPLAALLAGLIGGAWFYRDMLSAYWPNDKFIALNTKLIEVETAARASQAETKSIGNELATLRTKIDEAGSADFASKSDLTALQAAAGDLAQRLQKSEELIELNRKTIATVEANLAQQGTANNTTRTAPPEVSKAELEELRQKLSLLAQEVSAIKSAKPAVSRIEAVTASLFDLKQKMASGAPFASELSALTALDPGLAVSAELQAASSTGLATTERLVEELKTIAGKLPKANAEAATPDDSYSGWFLDKMSGLVAVRTIGETEWASAAMAAAQLAETGKLAEAADALGKTGESPPAPITDWLKRAQAHIAAEQALSQMTENVLQSVKSQE